MAAKITKAGMLGMGIWLGALPILGMGSANADYWRRLFFSPAPVESFMPALPDISGRDIAQKIADVEKKRQYNPGGLSDLAMKNIYSLTPEEKTHVIERLKNRESGGQPDAVSEVIRTRIVDGEAVSDTIYSIGENQINTSPGGALDDYNASHRRKFSEEDMLNPRRNRMVRDWYLLSKLPKMLVDHGLEATVANVLSGYNAGAGTLIKAGGDAVRNFPSLPSETQDYLVYIIGRKR